MPGRSPSCTSRKIPVLPPLMRSDEYVGTRFQSSRREAHSIGTQPSNRNSVPYQARTMRIGPAPPHTVSDGRARPSPTVPFAAFVSPCLLPLHDRPYRRARVQRLFAGSRKQQQVFDEALDTQALPQYGLREIPDTDPSGMGDGDLTVPPDGGDGASAARARRRTYTSTMFGSPSKSSSRTCWRMSRCERTAPARRSRNSRGATSRAVQGTASPLHHTRLRTSPPRYHTEPSSAWANQSRATSLTRPRRRPRTR